MPMLMNKEMEIENLRKFHPTIDFSEVELITVKIIEL